MCYYIYVGVKHVGGDMLSGIPSADAIMMKVRLGYIHSR